MKTTAQQIAARTPDPKPHDRSYPLSKTQTTVLSALGITADNHRHAEVIFEAMGIVVTNKRDKGKYVPVVRIKSSGGFNLWGEGEGEGGANCDISALKEWMTD